MDLKIVVNRLEKEEITYELRIRGISTLSNVSDMRKSLRNLLKLEHETSHQSSPLRYPKYPFSFKEDMTYVLAKVNELETLIKDFADDENSSMYEKITTKLAHTFQRVNRAIATEDTEFAERQQVLISVMNLHSDLKSRLRKIKRLSRTSEMPADLSVLMSSTACETSSDSESSDNDSNVASNHPSASSPVVTAVVPTANQYKLASVPVYKWNIVKFDGEKSKISLCAFLEQVEELRVSRNITTDQLFKSAGDLFAGKAKIWYNGMKNSLHSWNDLVRELRMQYLGSNTEYNKELLKEIRRRSQHSDESIGIYLACINTLFNRLTVPVSEKARLEIVLDNLAPYYKRELGMLDIQSLDQLLHLGRKAEANKKAIEAYVPPPKHKNFLEPDLAYIYAEPVSSEPSTSSDITVTRNKVSCWNCKELGHRARQCPSQVKNRYCFKCGNANCTVKTCSKCNSGNVIRRH